MQVIIYGNGAMAKVLYSYAKNMLNVAAFCVDDCCIKENETTFCKLPLIPFSKVEDIYSPKEYKMISTIGFIDMNELRERKYIEAKEKGYAFTSYIHPSVNLPQDVKIGENCIILDFVSIHTGSIIGHSTFISSNTNIGHDCIIEPLNWINSGVSIAGECKVGKGCFFGVNSSVGNSLKIGSQNYIAANTLINKNTENNKVYITPAGEMLERFSSKKFLKFLG